MKSPTVRTSSGAAQSGGLKLLSIPIFIFVLLYVWEASYGLYISWQMNRMVSATANMLAIQYERSHGFVADIVSQQRILDNARCALVIESRDQIQANWQLGRLPISLTVSAKYMPGKGDPPLPPYPVFDPFHWISEPIKATVTIPLK